jgi:glycosyltransferase involved in cell wall biosynthesis
VVVGADLARRYRRSRDLLSITVSLVSRRDVAPAEVDERPTWTGDIRILSVGRLDPEKNSLMLADVLARLGPGWRLVVCGEGPQRAALEARLRELGVRQRADLFGYVPLEDGLLELYRDSHLLLHCSWTEGVPQVLYEAFTQRLPVVATDVGGVREATNGAALLVPPGDAEAAAQALQALAVDQALRDRLVEAGFAHALGESLEAGTERIAAFLEQVLVKRARWARWT